MTYPTSYLECCIDRESATKVNKVIARDQLQHSILLHVPDNVPVKYVSVYNIAQISPKYGKMFIKGPILINYRPWIELNCKDLDSSIGYHVYKLQFIVHRTMDVFDCYFSYTVQDNNPEKPYLYMNREEI